ncbi:solute carrier family 35 member F5-like [Gordionus sp. m RMFG-2023]|uniref:solute carrier family 35 member F5-like n=1 Tax=Gordionus sp. m RMFG-2023 TaxID=3053472 RepID=UPI0031FBD6B0
MNSLCLSFSYLAKISFDVICNLYFYVNNFYRRKKYNLNKINTNNYTYIECNSRQVIADEDLKEYQNSSFLKNDEYKNINHIIDNETEDLLINQTFNPKISENKLNFLIMNKDILKVSSFLAILYFSQNYSYSLALSFTSPSLVNVLSSTSSLFVLLFDSIIKYTKSKNNSIGDFQSYKCERFCFYKLLYSLLSVSGVLLISFSNTKLDLKRMNNSTDKNSIQIQQFYLVNITSNQAIVDIPLYCSYNDFNQSSVLKGAVFSLSGAIIYSLYCLSFQLFKGSNCDIRFFISIIGVWSLFLLWPLFSILNFFCIEIFELPSSLIQWIIIIFNGLIGSMLTSIIYIIANIYTSPLIITLGTTLTIPMTILYDIVFSHLHFSILFYMGTLNILISFIGTAFLI